MGTQLKGPPNPSVIKIHNVLMQYCEKLKFMQKFHNKHKMKFHIKTSSVTAPCKALLESVAEGQDRDRGSEGEDSSREEGAGAGTRGRRVREPVAKPLDFQPSSCQGG